jgi:hypothetical protein
MSRHASPNSGACRVALSIEARFGRRTRLPGVVRACGGRTRLTRPRGPGQLGPAPSNPASPTEERVTDR